MQKIMIFNMPEDTDSYIAADQGMQTHFCLWDLQQWLRKKIKYRDSVDNLDEATLISVQDELFSILSNYNISLDDIT